MSGEALLGMFVDDVDDLVPFHCASGVDTSTFTGTHAWRDDRSQTLRRPLGRGTRSGEWQAS